EGITTISYYTRGEQLAAVLDLDIRRRTHGAKSLNDAMRWLWTNTYHAPRATYYLPGRGYTDADVEHAIEAAAGGASYADFFRDYVAGTQLLPYDDYLSAAGLKLACSVPEGVNSYSGVYLAGNQVRGVAPASPAEAAGFGSGQRLESLDSKALAALPPGQPATVAVVAHGQRLNLTLSPVAPQATQCTIEEIPGATAEQKALRAAWLAGR